jgi:hypothetical protein
MIIACVYYEDCHIDMNSTRPLIGLGLVIESAVFSLFTLIMCCDVTCSIMSKTSTIDRLQMAEATARKFTLKERFENLKEVFGDKINRSWLWPFPPRWRKMALYDKTNGMMV